MKTCKKCLVSKDSVQFYADKKAKDGLFSYCKDCQKSHRLAYYKANSETEKSKFKVYRETNVETIKLRQQHYFANNKSKINAITRKYQASKLKKTPAWLTQSDIFEIECIYKYCSALRSIGLEYEVDHIIPLQGKDVSGLHVPTNLQVIHRTQNRSKHNRSGVSDEQ